LRADSAKWREERLRNYRSQGISLQDPDLWEPSNYVLGGYNESATRQEAMWSDNLDERLPGTYNPPANYRQMAPPANLPMAARPQEYGTRVTYQTYPAMSPQAVPGAYRNTGAYLPSEPKYTYSTAQPQGGYSVMDSSRDRMETTTGQPWNMQSFGYPSGTAPIASSYAPARPTYNYPQVGGNPPVPAGYGRADPQGNYDPYGPRGAYIHRSFFSLSSPQVRSV
jgi:hypothetical protein